MPRICVRAYVVRIVGYMYFSRNVNGEFSEIFRRERVFE